MVKFQTIDDLAEECRVNPKGVNAWWVNIKRFSKTEEIDNIKQLLGLSEVNNIIESVYEKLNARPKCVCGEPVLFKSFSIGYSNYCSLKCSRKDGNKTPVESKKIGAQKRSITLKDRYNDPILGPQYRKKISDASKKSATPKERARRSELMKNMIADGRLTPSITNTWTRWSVEFDNRKFRSSWEAVFYAYHRDNIEYESLRIPYVYDGCAKTYIIDFVDHTSKIVYEIKPMTLIETPQNIAKLNALSEWCKTNNYAMQIVTEVDIRKMFSVVNEKYNDAVFKKIKEAYGWH